MAYAFWPHQTLDVGLSFSSFLRPQRSRVVVGVIAMAAAGVLTAFYAYLSGPLLVALLTGEGPGRFAGVSGTEGPWITTFAFVLVGVALVKGLVHLGQVALLTKAVEEAGRGLRHRVFDHLLRRPLRAEGVFSRGDLVTRVVDDVARVQQAVFEAPLVLIREGVAALALAGVAVFMAPQLAALGILVLPVTAMGVAALSRKVKEAAAAGQAETGHLAARTLRGLEARREVKSFQAEAAEGGRFDAHCAARARWATRQQVLRAFSPLINEVSAALAIAGVLLYAAGLVGRGALSAAALISFLTAIFMLYRPVKAMGNALQARAAGAASIERVDEVLALPQEEPVGSPLPALEQTVALRGVGFRVDDEWILRGVSVELRKGEVVGLGGPSGAGKSTLADVLSGLLVATEGQWGWDGSWGAAGEGARLRTQVSLVPQRPLLLDASLRENLTFGVLEESDDELWRALARVRLGQWAQGLAGGLDAFLGEGGVPPSGGELQRIALARALLGSSSVIVLDEPAAGLDRCNEEALISTLGRLRIDHAVLLITHRKTLLAAADRVVHLEGGRMPSAPASEARWKSCNF
ncbi:MAG: ABC transporter ATP-binding protein [Deltaproteobacteria bacterium]|nr:ABC transporter ATP-binding protein [Deltaproteobacteria bacterium]